MNQTLKQGENSSYTIASPVTDNLSEILALFKEQMVHHYQLDPIYYVPYTEELEFKIQVHVKKLIQENKPNILVAKSDEKILGFVTFADGKEEYGDTNIRKFGEIKELFVIPSARNQGIGRTLVAAAEEVFKAQGLKHIVIKSSSFNADAEKVYKKLGYSPRQTVFFKGI